jgi:hypothetical protein
MGTRPPPPLWFVLLLGVAEALAVRALTGSIGVGEGEGSPAPPLSLAFWPFLILVASWIWTGIQVAGRITLQILAYSVKLLWAFATRIQSALIAVGRTLIDVGKQAWRFLRWTYTDVLQPAWRQFWKWFDQLRKWLDKTFGPTLRFLDAVRTHILKFYDKWVRPILDVIGFARQVLGILASLGLEWARELDRKLRWLEEKIDAPFRLVLAKLNEIIGIVNRVVTADGLFQRVALLRSTFRDANYVVGLWWKTQYEEPSAETLENYRKQPEEKPIAFHIREFRSAITGSGTDITEEIAEHTMDLRIMLRR